MKNKFILLSTLLMILWPTLDLSAINIEPDKNPKTNVITYTATEKLAMTLAGWNSIHYANFNVEIIAHDFSDGKGTITFAGKVTTIGKYAFYGCSDLTSITIPNSVTTIEESAFGGCSDLTSITIPNSVTTIEEYAFGSGLTSVTINSNVICGKDYTLQSSLANLFGSQVTEYIIGPSVRSIGDYAFSRCSGLTSITIPNSVATIGEEAFYGCSKLESIFVNSANTHYISVDGVLFSYSKNALIKFPSSNKQQEYAIPSSVKTIENGAFDGCSSLTSVTIPNSVTTIGDYAFYECSGLTSVTIPNSVTTIGYEAFQDCSGLTSVTIGNSVATIEHWTFSGCSCLTSVSIDSNTICDADYTSNKNISNIFGSQVTEYIIGPSVRSIGEYAFYRCGKLTSVTIGNSVNTIEENAFASNSYLTDVVIGVNVTRIGCNAFAGDTRIENITCYAPVTPNMCNTTFGDLDKSVIYLYVPADYQRKYQVDPNWKGFDLHLIGAEQAQTGDKVTVTPSANEATFVWPQNDQAAEYSIEITKDGVVFCTLKFNANGQLTGIAFAPGRGHTAMAHAATTTGAGWQFTVTGLNQASKYAYTMDVKNASQKSIKTYTGEFVTDGYTDLLPLPYEGKDGIGSVKFIHNGHLLIERNGNLYNAHGARVK